MFEWLKRQGAGSSGIDRMDLEFGQMLDSGRQVFLTAANAILGGTDPEVIREDLFKTDRRINRSEQRIRREIVVHVSVQGTTNLNECLILMSVVKDAERIGDYAKNIFDLAVQAPALARDEHHADLVALKDRIGEALTSARTVWDLQDIELARKVTRELAAIEDHCDDRVEKALGRQQDITSPATIVLLYRYFKRITAHAMNVTTSVFMPLDKIDFFDEKPRPAIRDGDGDDD